MNEQITIEVTRALCGHDARVASFRFIEAPEHIRFNTSSLDECLHDLVLSGFAFSVHVVEIEISLGAWYSLPAEPPDPRNGNEVRYTSAEEHERAFEAARKERE